MMLISLFGAFGAMARYFLSRLLPVARRSYTPILLVNWCGTALLAISQLYAWPPFMTFGFCGAFTTMSTFALEAVELVEQGEKKAAVQYVALSVIGSVFIYAFLTKNPFS